MNISYSWLKEYVDFDLQPEEVAKALTSIGLEVGGVEEIETVKGGLKGLVVGEVLECEAHPNSDHMHICQVNVGGDEPVQIVCGASNVAAGQKVIVATLGTVLYGEGDETFTIKRSKLRGVESLGMICAEDEIGVGTSHEGIIVLPADTPVGMPAATYYNIKSEYVIEVDITPNRADAFSHYGVARDFHAWLVRNGYETSLRKPSVEDYKKDNDNLCIPVEVEAVEACPRYCAVTLTGCEVKESPEWLQNKLRTIGVRPINNIVDVTNYVMMAYGQPLHCFDADMIKGGKVIVKTLPEGTKFVTLDGEEHTLSNMDLAICNTEDAMCIAGVFGGKGSGTYDSTTNVLLESAYFHPTWVRKSARRHGLNTDASFRFERGVDPNGQLYALKAAALMIKELAGGQISMDIVDVNAGTVPTHFPVEVEYSYINKLIGKEITPDVVKEILSSLEIQVVSETETTLNLSVPAYRVDVCRPCDVVEEILRIYGYNNVENPTAVKASLNIKGDVDRSNKVINLVAEQLVGAGFNEILNNSLTREAYYADLTTYPANRAVRLMNPLSSDLSVMRQTLLFGGLETIAYNANRKRGNLRLFEQGNCYSFDADRHVEDKALSGYAEAEHLALWVTGNRVEGSWAHANEESTVYELKAYVMNIFTRIGLNMAAFVVEPGTSDIFGKSLVIKDRNGKVCAEWGLVKKAITSQLGINQPVYFAELNWTELMKKTKKQTVLYKELSKFPAVSRDLALLVDKNVEFAAIEKAAYQAEKKLLKRVELFDVYEGKNLEAGKKSYAVNFTLQDETKTMSDKQTEAIMQKIIKTLQTQVGAQLR